jgi:hypothetical protein
MRARPRGTGELLAWALVPKAALVLLLVAVGLRWSADERHIAPRAPGTPAAVWVLARGWDCDAYQRIAVQGYYDEYSRNYPPGYPALIRVAALVAPDTQVAAVLVSNVAALLALLVFARPRAAARGAGRGAAAGHDGGRLPAGPAGLGHRGVQREQRHPARAAGLDGLPARRGGGWRAAARGAGCWRRAGCSGRRS